MHTVRWGACVIALLAGSGCDDGADDAPDANVINDGAVADDGPLADARLDANTVDAMPDAAPIVDAMPDAAPIVDAMPDAAPIVDAMPDPGPFGPAPDAFRRKVLLEYTAGASFQYMPDADAIALGLLEAHPDSLILVTHHFSDAMDWPETDDIVNYYELSFPVGLLDRDPGPESTGIRRADWRDALAARLPVPSPCGLAIDARDPGAILVQAQCADLPAEPALSLLAFVVQHPVRSDRGPGYDQQNADNGTPGHPAQGRGNPIVGYEHPFVSRAMLTDPVRGDPVALVDGGVSQIFAVPPETCVGDGCSIVFALMRAGERYEVLNTQSVDLGALQGWTAAE